jgi:hypothetical protein
MSNEIPQNEPQDEGFGVLVLKNQGGRPPKAFQKKLTYKQGGKLLKNKNAKELVDLLEEAGGDIDAFSQSFDRRIDTKQKVLTRVLFILQQPGNEDELKRWNQLLNCHRQAKMALLEKEAMDHLADMPKPNKKTNIRDWLTYSRFFTEDIREHAKQKARINAKGSSADAEDEKARKEQEAIKQMVEAMTKQSPPVVAVEESGLARSSQDKQQTGSTD